MLTGITGFIAQHIALALLDRGYQVRGTARSQAKADQTKALLRSHHQRADDIEIHITDLLSDQGWTQAVAGCEFVIHTASPIPTVLPRDPDGLIAPARDGTLRVLKAAQAAQVSRVVMTSSVAAVMYGVRGLIPAVFDESHWSDPSYLQDNTAYTRSKTLAERAAWEFIDHDGAGLELTTICPALVLGPVLSPDFSASVEVVTQLLSGKLPGLPQLGYQVVDVRDVAAAHILALDHPAAAGERFIVAEEFMVFEAIADLLRQEFPTYGQKLPSRYLPSWMLRLLSWFNPALQQVIPDLDRKRYCSFEKAQQVLGWHPRSAQTAIIDAAQSLIKCGAV